MKHSSAKSKRYKHFYAKDESTHPSMVSTHQHIFKGKMCKNVDTVSTHVKSVSTRVAVFQKSSLPRSTHSQSRSTLDPVSRTTSLKNWVSRSTHSQSRSTLDPVPRIASLQIWDSRSTHSQSRSTRDPLPRTAFYIFWTVDTLPGQVDTRPSSQNSQFEELGQQVDTLKSRSTRDLSPRTGFSIFGIVCRHNHQGRSTHYGNFSS
ncbi:hypothetical protein Taro_025203 [Colocasia esculenta]|uniref:Uncharacterized protein n=1 Tax=Colocasia esculenta TaxID=4460 RepID=A0A843VDJ5_COLES|nr:hypothetical protein [Colocasia esculenta]